MASKKKREVPEEDTDSDDWSLQKHNQDLSYALVIALRFKFKNTTPTDAELATYTHSRVRDVFKAKKCRETSTLCRLLLTGRVIGVYKQSHAADPDGETKHGKKKKMTAGNYPRKLKKKKKKRGMRSLMRMTSGEQAG